MSAFDGSGRISKVDEEKRHVYGFSVYLADGSTTWQTTDMGTA